MDLKTCPKIHVLCIVDKKFWLSNVKHQISSANMHIYRSHMHGLFMSGYPDGSHTTTP